MIHIRNGDYGLIEIKFGAGGLIEESAETLKDLSSKINIKNIFKPSFMMVLCAKGLLPIKERMVCT